MEIFNKTNSINFSHLFLILRLHNLFVCVFFLNFSSLILFSFIFACFILEFIGVVFGWLNLKGVESLS